MTRDSIMDQNETKTDDQLKAVDSIPGYLVLSDEESLAQLGHQQELKRQFSLTTLGALCLCLMATWEALSTVIAEALLNGGAPCLFYNFVLSFLCSVCIASSLGEIAYIYPTAGGQYHWVAALCPPRSRSLAAFTTGWISVGGLIVFCASAAFAAGLQTQSLIAVLLYSAALNIWGSKMLPHANMISLSLTTPEGILHVVGCVVILVVLGVMAPKITASFVFTEVVNSSGWENDGVSWLVGLISAVYPFLGYDAACHMAEEIPINAPRNVPIAMVGSVTVNGLMGLIYGTVLLFSTGLLESLLTTPTGFPFMQIYLDVTRSRAGATVLSLLVILIAIAAKVVGITSASRTLWAFARDRAVPFDSHFSYINKILQVPVTSIVFVTVSQILLGFLYLANTTAFNAVLSMAIIGIYLSYSIPVAYMLFVGRSKLARKEYGPFRLGPVVGPVLNAITISLVWMTVVIIFSTFPSSQPVTAQNMNYSTVVMAGWLVFGLVYYFIRGRAKFEVPVVVSDIVEGVRDI
ncbi:amino acid/polyamine transporter I [Colletotrichum phormii]|uniref:Amino acid/polyamine transporter I n=1 Tax=Colletotrichum phormii TaxID=359342 RepID=A0AAI9ZGN8_9PEZI|nr:amino acid/polyamine transporter I [Colletotrichum phormii]KAK1623019.1 amino acid/polyamine transporter I [Colletotrichum phormii]